MRNDLEARYRNNLVIILDSLRSYAFGNFKAQDAEDLVQNTLVYFLERFSKYKNHTFEHLEGTAILKIRGLNIDEIRRFYANADLVEILDPGDGNQYNIGQIIHIREIKIENKKLNESNQILIRYRPYVRLSHGNSNLKTKNISPERKIHYEQNEKLLNQIGSKCKNLIKSQIYRELSYKDICKEFNMKMGTVMSSLSRCWSKLRDLA